MIILLTILSAVLILIFALSVLFLLYNIQGALEKIGGRPNSYLARLGYGARAIEQETSHLAPQVTRLNDGLTLLGTKLGVVNEDLKSIAEALSTGKGG